MDISELNISLFRLINNLGKHVTYLDPVMTFIAEYMVFILVLTVILFWLTRRNVDRIMVICGFITFGVAEIIGKVAGNIHSNHQPFAELANVNKLIGHEIDNSFPSDHTILFFSFCVTFYLFKKRAGMIWISLACFVGLSRIWAGVHYPADVMVGAAISIFTALIVYQTVPKLNFIKKWLALYEKGEQVILPTKSKSKEY